MQQSKKHNIVDPNDHWSDQAEVIVTGARLLNHLVGVTANCIITGNVTFCDVFTSLYSDM